MFCRTLYVNDNALDDFDDFLTDRCTLIWIAAFDGFMVDRRLTDGLICFTMLNDFLCQRWRMICVNNNAVDYFVDFLADRCTLISLYI